MIKDWLFLDRYYEELLGDTYEQPVDAGHTKMAQEILEEWLPGLNIKTVVDMGCGKKAFCAKYFDEFGIEYIGVELGIYSVEYPAILDADFNFTLLPDDSFDMVFSRHSLEHSPFPLLTLMEWHRIARKYLLLVLPNPEYYTYMGRNHYSVVPAQQARWLLRRAGWKMEKWDYSEFTELRFLCSKQPRVSYEGYLNMLDTPSYERDRDG